MHIKQLHRILIVADAFGKPSYAPRLRFLSEYLVHQGWEVEVYTEHFVPLDFQHSYPIFECTLYRNSTWDWAIKAAFSIITDWKNRAFSRWLFCNTRDKKYDIVYCTTCSTFPLRAALDIAKVKHLPLHVDLRDIEEQAPNSQLQAHRQWWARPFRKIYSNVNISRRNNVIRQAQSVTTISPWHVDFLRSINAATHLIYNGYDKDIFYPNDISTDTFRIVYTGRIYESALRDPILFIQAVSTLPPLANFSIDWYTDDKGKEVIRRLSAQYGCGKIMHYYDYVSTNTIPNLLHQCGIALVLSHKATEDGPHGIMTTKFFEALGVEKPVLCVPSDEECLAAVIKDTNAGIAATTVEEVRAFILEKYNEWKKNGFTRQAVNPEKKKLFSRQYQAQQFELLFTNIIS